MALQPRPIGCGRLCEIAACKKRLSRRTLFLRAGHSASERRREQRHGAPHQRVMYSRKGRRPFGTKAGLLMMQIVAAPALSGQVAQAAPPAPPTTPFTTFMTGVMAGRVQPNISETMKSQSEGLSQV